MSPPLFPALKELAGAAVGFSLYTALTAVVYSRRLRVPIGDVLPLASRQGALYTVLYEMMRLLVG
ncbi:MAG TPA: hypothetical protein VF234_03375 [Limnochordia bacterium]